MSISGIQQLGEEHKWRAVNFGPKVFELRSRTQAPRRDALVSGRVPGWLARPVLFRYAYGRHSLASHHLTQRLRDHSNFPMLPILLTVSKDASDLLLRNIETA